MKNNDEHKSSHVRFEVFTLVTMKNAVFWDVTPGITSQKAAFFISVRFGQF
jgi:hypothetical protein